MLLIYVKVMNKSALIKSRYCSSYLPFVGGLESDDAEDDVITVFAKGLMEAILYIHSALPTRWRVPLMRRVASRWVNDQLDAIPSITK